ncbi:MAG: SIR2 family protein [Verrucomicrobia bacterium]|nr:SIR2 family protein [Verrucomicrobiota bacterium]
MTTNFDSHFNTAAKAVFGGAASDMIVHHAPALPLGDDFSGLIYMHGVLHEPHDRCVMTDRDFGAAYLTHGWARRFVLRLFAKYTVLFAGYSHEDTVMNYLARGMPGTGNKFAFVPLGEESKWNFQLIKCVSYSKYEAGKADNEHLQITEACREWVAELDLTPTQRHGRLQQIYFNGPDSLNDQDKDFVFRCLRHEESSYGFFGNPPKKPWIAWMLEAGLLDHFFDRSVQPTDHQRQIIRWAIFDGFIEAEALLWNRAVSLNFSLNPSASRMIAIQIRRRSSHEDAVFRKWLTVLLQQHEGDLPLDQLAWLIEACRLPEEAEVALAILASQLKPKVEANTWWRLLE